MSIIFIFLDGFGLGDADQHNPHITCRTPFLRQVLGGPLVKGIDIEQQARLARGIDPCLGVPGVPQSATGQTALFTGINAPALLGEHLGAYPNAQLQELIAQHSILKRAIEQGHQAALANAYSPLYWHLVAERKRRHSASTLTCLAAGLPFFDFVDLREERAVYWDITHSTIPLRYAQLGKDRPPYRDPVTAGRVLASLGKKYSLVLFESFLPDMVGHGKLPHTVRWTVYVLDTFLDAVYRDIRPEDSIVLSSDHGNFEHMGNGMHTLNPVPLLVLGPAAPAFRGVQDITGVAPAILNAL